MTVKKTDQDWKAELSPAQYHVLREHGTEPPGSHPLNHEKRKGTFVCAGCDLPLFKSETKYDRWSSANHSRKLGGRRKSCSGKYDR